VLEYIANWEEILDAKGEEDLRPEEPKKGGAIAAGSLRAIQDGLHLLPIGGGCPACFTIPFLLLNDSLSFLLVLVYFLRPLACFRSAQSHLRVERTTHDPFQFSDSFFFILHYITAI
jgi:hypothetical protein